MTISKKLDRNSEEYLAITRMQKPVDGYVPYAERLNQQWIESTCYFLRRIYGCNDSR